MARTLFDSTTGKSVPSIEGTIDWINIPDHHNVTEIKLLESSKTYICDEVVESLRMGDQVRLYVPKDFSPYEVVAFEILKNNGEAWLTRQLKSRPDNCALYSFRNQ
jgi:hypothetical protein